MWRGGFLPPCRIEKRELTWWGGSLPPCCVEKRELTWWGGSLPPCCVEKRESTWRGGFDPPCCVNQHELTRRGGLSPPCRVDACATRGPNPYPYPSKPVPVSTGTGFRRVWVRVLVELPMGYLWRALLAERAQSLLYPLPHLLFMSGLSTRKTLLYHPGPRVVRSRRASSFRVCRIHSASSQISAGVRGKWRDCMSLACSAISFVSSLLRSLHDEDSMAFDCAPLSLLCKVDSPTPKTRPAPQIPLVLSSWSQASALVMHWDLVGTLPSSVAFHLSWWQKDVQSGWDVQLITKAFICHGQNRPSWNGHHKLLFHQAYMKTSSVCRAYVCHNF